MSNQLESSALISIIVDERRTASPDFFNLLSGFQWESLRTKALRAGISPESLSVVSLSDFKPEQAQPGRVLIGLGEKTLFTLTGKRGIDKWQLSPLPLNSGALLLPSFDLARIQKQYELNLYLEVAFHRAAEFSRSPFIPHVERFHLNPGVEETLALLEHIKGKELAIDVETGYGQINTVGFAWSPQDAIAINVLPDRCGDLAYFELWSRIRELLEADTPKVLQNFMYDTSYFSAYGIETKGEIFDTMHAMRVLWPEFDINLGNVGRLYTRRPYWKDDGKVESEEGKKKDWGNVRDWTRHYLYNCRDTTGTFEASQAQRKDLAARGLESFYSSYIAKLIAPAREMCAVGMPLDLGHREKVKKEIAERIAHQTRAFHTATGKEINPSSPKQIQDWLKTAGVKLPKKYDKEKGESKETTDSSALKKIRLKNDLPGLKELQEIKTLKKALSSYIDFEARPDGRLSYSLNITGTETLRWSGGKDPWGRGLNIQTLPHDNEGISIKSFFLAPEGYSFIECDLRQAESRFVAYRAADKTLIDMLESNSDVHTYVGKAIMRQKGLDPASVPKEEFKKTWRQLGKKAGHGLNYGMKARVFQETVFNELDMVITLDDAEVIRSAYYALFPGIPRWHAWVRNELYTKRKLTAPSGWERYFYGRPGDDMLKEGLAWEPQHTIPWITNRLMLFLFEKRKDMGLKFNFISQVHDALYLLVPDEEVEATAKLCLNHKAWHPTVLLPGGRMEIPTECKVGKRLSESKEWQP